MERVAVQSNDAPDPVGPYSQAVIAGEMVFLSGQIAIDPSTNQMINSSLADEARQVFTNIDAVLKEAGLTRKNIVRTDISLTDMNDFAELNELYANWLGTEGVMPARQTVEVSKLPKDARVEISCIAVK